MGLKSRRTERQRPHQTPEDPKSGPCIKVSRPSASFYVRIRLVLRRQICRDTARAAALHLSAKKKGLSDKTPKSPGVVVLGRTGSATRPTQVLPHARLRGKLPSMHYASMPNFHSQASLEGTQFRQNPVRRETACRNEPHCQVGPSLSYYYEKERGPLQYVASSGPVTPS